MPAASSPRAPSTSDAARREAGREAHVEGAVHVSAAQRREELHVGKLGERGGGRDDGVGRLGERLPAEHDDEVALATVERSDRAFDLSVTRCGAVARQRARQLRRDRRRLTRRVAEHRRRVTREAGRAWRDLDHGNLEVDRGASHA